MDQSWYAMDLPTYRNDDHQDQEMQDSVDDDQASTIQRLPVDEDSGDDEASSESGNGSATGIIRGSGEYESEAQHRTTDGTNWNPLAPVKQKHKPMKAQQNADSLAAAKERLKLFEQAAMEHTTAENERRKRKDSVIAIEAAEKKKAAEKQKLVAKKKERKAKKRERRASKVSEEALDAMAELRSLGRPYEKTLSRIIDYATTRLDGEEGFEGQIGAMLEVEQTMKKSHKENLAKLVEMLERQGAIPFGGVEDGK